MYIHRERVDTTLKAKGQNVVNTLKHPQVIKWPCVFLSYIKSFENYDSQQLYTCLDIPSNEMEEIK